MSDHTFHFPETSLTDVAWAAELLRLPPTAFSGNDGHDPRTTVLVSSSTIDVTACPGSGKTTLLVAKLAILARKWSHRTRGICVLSHTNAARHEIESRLGRTSLGRQLLAYPHFIGTIHAFVNEFLAVPWLRSLGYPVNVIDKEICETRRWQKIERNLRAGLEQRRIFHDSLMLADTDFNIRKTRGTLGFASTTRTYRALRAAFKTVAAEGYHAYDDMFIWAEDLLEKGPFVKAVLRDRFPVLFIDEAQDNSETQAAILQKVFTQGGSPCIRQRFGDPNQAIYDFIEGEETTTDPFPDDNISLAVPNSHRFGQRIATLADPLGLSPYDMIGRGPGRPLASGATEARHTIFVFDDDSIDQVIPHYGELLLATFSDEELERGTFTALGNIHTQTGDDHPPRHVGHYWREYNPILSRSDPHPARFVEYVMIGQGRAAIEGESHSAVNSIARGITRLAEIATGQAPTKATQNKHRQVMAMLETRGKEHGQYVEFVTRYGVESHTLTAAIWQREWQPIIRGIAKAIAGVALTGDGVDEFLHWPKDDQADVPGSIGSRHDTNDYYYIEGDRKVTIRLGSIHSAKGETHTATLVLETYWYRHNLQEVLPWLLGANSGSSTESKRQQKRLKAHYVAMTRPTHLLCLAMKQAALKSHDIDTLEGRGWHIERVAQ